MPGQWFESRNATLNVSEFVKWIQCTTPISNATTKSESIPTNLFKIKRLVISEQ